jgi:N-acetylmuramoyl-L-alanine amidase CwlA
MTKEKNRRVEKITKTSAEVPFFREKNKKLEFEKISVSPSEKKCLDFASQKKYKEVLELMDGYESCLQKQWIDPNTKELTQNGKKALTVAIFGS